MIFDLINKKYDGRIELQEPVNCDISNLPESLREILMKSNGIKETMNHPKTGELMYIGWIIYSYEEMIRATEYYKKEYGISGIVFADDGAGDPFYLEEDKVYCFDVIDNESEWKADSLSEFFVEDFD